MEIILASFTILAAIAFAKSVWSFSREFSDLCLELNVVKGEIERLRGTIEAMKVR